MDPRCRQAWRVKGCLSRTAGTSRRTSASLSAEARPPAASSWFVPNIFRPAEFCDPNPRMGGVFPSASPQNISCSTPPSRKVANGRLRLPVHSLSAADPCGHGTDRHKRTEHYHEYTHHFSKGLKLPMGTMVKPSSFTFRLLKSNSSSKELPKLSSTTTIKLCASSPSAV